MNDRCPVCIFHGCPLPDWNSLFRARKIFATFLPVSEEFVQLFSTSVLDDCSVVNNKPPKVGIFPEFHPYINK
jgi:hypothetical protein